MPGLFSAPRGWYWISVDLSEPERPFHHGLILNSLCSWYAPHKSPALPDLFDAHLVY